jgi:DNA-directed RNA polymerase subunit RPC12/RpoP
MVTRVQISYIEAVITCPHCGTQAKSQLPGEENAIPAGSEFVCAACGVVYEIFIRRPNRDAQLRNEADRAGADELGTFVSCPRCGRRRNLYANTVAYCQHCGDRTFVYAG